MVENGDEKRVERLLCFWKGFKGLLKHFKEKATWFPLQFTRLVLMVAVHIDVV